MKIIASHVLFIVSFMSLLSGQDYEVKTDAVESGSQSSYSIREMLVKVDELGEFNIKLISMSLKNKDKMIIVPRIDKIDNLKREPGENKIFGKVLDKSRLEICQYISGKNFYQCIATNAWRANSPNKITETTIETNQGTVIDTLSWKSYIEVPVVDYSGMVVITGRHFAPGLYELSINFSLR